MMNERTRQAMNRNGGDIVSQDEEGTTYRINFPNRMRAASFYDQAISDGLAAWILFPQRPDVVVIKVAP